MKGKHAAAGFRGRICLGLHDAVEKPGMAVFQCALFANFPRASG